MVREGGQLSFWCDGVRAWTKTDCELKVTGLLDQTDGTEVKGGRLVLQSPALQPEVFAVYDFEDETMLGREANGTGRNLTDVADVTRVWDAERQSWVARFSGTKSEKLSKTISTPVHCVGIRKRSSGCERPCEWDCDTGCLCATHR